ncbi:hypothetical protein AADW59_00045 [Candidatus Hodgkinia cicadicola]
MFSGLVERLGIISTGAVLEDGVRFGLMLNANLDFKAGDSVCCSGVCLTVVDVWRQYVELEIWRVSLGLSNFGGACRLDLVNVERSLSLNARLHGDVVSGHVVSAVVLLEARVFVRCALLRFRCPFRLGRCLEPLSSLSINGVCLTVVDVDDLCFWICLIRFSILHTAFASFVCGKEFNFEPL